MATHIEIAKKALESTGLYNPEEAATKAQAHALISIAESLEVLAKAAASEDSINVNTRLT